jgi:L-iditol 2-dehydrogenase
VRIESVDVPDISAGEALISVKSVGICGSDLEKWSGRMSARIVPLLLGHEFSGVISKLSSEASNFKTGDRVYGIPFIPCKKCHYCMHGRASLCINRNLVGSNMPGACSEYVKIPAENLIHIPDGVSFEEAAMTEPLTTALYGIEKLGITKGDSVAVLGCGPIGLLVVQLAKNEGASTVFCTDIKDYNLKIAGQFGATCINARKENAAKKIMESTGGLGVDRVIETSGAKPSVMSTFEIAKKGGKIVQLGILTEPISISLWYQFMTKDLELAGFSSGQFEPRLYRKGLELISKGKISVKPIITHTLPLTKAKEAFEMLSEGKEGVLKVMLSPGEM